MKGTRTRKTSGATGRTRGKLRIGDNWNAITIIALSQNNPLKAIAAFVENSIDARARNIPVVRGKEKGAEDTKASTGSAFSASGPWASG